MSKPEVGNADLRSPHSVKSLLWWMLKTDEHFRPLVGAVKNRPESAQLETAPTKRENGSFVFLTGPV